MNRTFRLAFVYLCVSAAACSDGPTGGGGAGGGGGGGGNNPGPPATVSVVSGSAQQVPAGQAAPAALVVKVADAQGRAVPSTTVTFAAAAGSGSVSSTSAATGADGQAQVNWTVGPSAGSHSVSAAVGALTATFTANVTPNATLNATVTLGSDMTPSMAQLAGSRARASKIGSFLGRRTVAAPVRTVERARVVPGALIVTLRPEAIGAPERGPRARMTRQQAAAVAGNMARVLDGHVRDGRRLRDVSPQLAAARIQVQAGMEEQAAAEIRRDSRVARVERDVYGYATAGVEPNDPFRLGQAWHYQMVDAPRAWKRTTGNNGVLVAVVDDGIRFDHPDVAPNLTTDGYDFVSSVVSDTECGARNNAGDGNGYDPDPTIPADYDGCDLSEAGGHGLHVAGTIGAVGNNGVGMSGVAWNVRIRPIRVLGTTGGGSYFDIAQGILYAAGLPASNGSGGVVQAASAARIINLSLGGPSNQQVLHNAVIAASNAGALLVVAAGNENTSAPSYPAAYPEVLTVSAVGPSRQRAGYSNWGAHVDIAAPGGDQGAGGFWAGIASTQWDFAAGTPTYNLISGTSMATPHVSGAAALLLAQTPSLTAAQLRSRLLDYAVDLGAAGPDPIFGVGLLNVRNSLAQSMTIEGRVFGRVYDAATGAIVREVQGNGTSFTVGQLGDGAFHVFAGVDDEGDGIFGTNGARWGGFTANGALQALTVQGAGTYPAAFTIGFATEREPNNTTATPTRLMLRGSLYGQITTETDADIYSVTLPAGTYVFETVGWGGSCGLTDADTELRLLSSAGATLAVNDDIDANRLNLCSRVTMAVAAGTYFVGVSGYSPGGYRVLVRPV